MTGLTSRVTMIAAGAVLTDQFGPVIHTAMITIQEGECRGDPELMRTGADQWARAESARARRV